MFQSGSVLSEGPSDNPVHLELVEACLRGQPWVVRQILEEKGDSINPSGLHYLCSEGGSVPCYELLVQAFPHEENKKNADGYTCLHLATLEGQTAMVRYLMERGANILKTDTDGHTCIHFAAVSGNPDLVTELLQIPGSSVNRGDVHRASPLHYAIHTIEDNARGLAMLKCLLDNGALINGSDKDGRRPIHWAINSGKKEAVKFLVENKADLNAIDLQGLHPFHVAASNGEASMLRSMCAGQRKPDLNVKDRMGCTPLFYAAGEKRVNTAKLLIDMGARIDLADRNDRTMSHYCAASGSLECLKILVRGGSKLFSRSTADFTPVEEAVKMRRIDIIEYLLEIPDLELRRRMCNFTSCLHLASMNNDLPVVKLLLDLRCRINRVEKVAGQYVTAMDVSSRYDSRESYYYIRKSGGLTGLQATYFHAKRIQRFFKRLVRKRERAENAGRYDDAQEWKGDDEVVLEPLLPKINSVAMVTKVAQTSLVRASAPRGMAVPISASSHVTATNHNTAISLVAANKSEKTSPKIVPSPKCTPVKFSSPKRSPAKSGWETATTSVVTTPPSTNPTTLNGKNFYGMTNGHKPMATATLASTMIRSVADIDQVTMSASTSESWRYCRQSLQPLAPVSNHNGEEAPKQSPKPSGFIGQLKRLSISERVQRSVQRFETDRRRGDKIKRRERDRVLGSQTPKRPGTSVSSRSDVSGLPPLSSHSSSATGRRLACHTEESSLTEKDEFVF